jgi:myosin heavy subunit
MRDFKDDMRDFMDEMRAFKDEMKDFKDEMKDFKDEMKGFKDEMKDFKDEMKDFKDEMKDFKDEMKDFKDEMGDFKKESNKKWGELANKMGTLVEDLVGPAFIPMAQRCFGEKIIDKAIYLRRQRKGVEGEFDIVAASETRVFLVEVKATLREAHIEAMLQHTIPLFRNLFPEYTDKPVVPILASLQIDDSLIHRCTKSRVYAMAFREWDYMDILNLKEMEGLV